MDPLLSARAVATRERIVSAATQLLVDGGRDAISTRTVSAAANVQAPTIYRLFGDMRGLLDAVATHGFNTYLADVPVSTPGTDPVEDLRAGWDAHVAFGLAHPALYSLMYGQPQPGAMPPAALAAVDNLRRLVYRVAEAGLLRVEEERATRLLHAAGCGTTLELIRCPEEPRHPSLSVAAREAVIAAITSNAPVGDAPGPVSAAVALRAVLPQVEVLSPAERCLLREWLERIARS